MSGFQRLRLQAATLAVMLGSDLTTDKSSQTLERRFVAIEPVKTQRLSKVNGKRKRNPDRWR